MYAQVEISKENKSRAVANSVAQKKSNGKQGFGFVDNRADNIAHNLIQNRTKHNFSNDSEASQLSKQPSPIQVTQFCFDKKSAYKNGYCVGYKQGYQKGLKDGLNELEDNDDIDKKQGQEIYENETSKIEVQPSSDWNSYFDARLSVNGNEQNGEFKGRGKGFDDGYEKAVSAYGYSRKYNSIPSNNRRTAELDNKGKCVYCNTAAIKDVDHIYPLKHHWSERGAMQDQTTRSAEANHLLNLVGSCASCNRSKGAKKLNDGWLPPAWNRWWPFGPDRVKSKNSPPPYW